MQDTPNKRIWHCIYFILSMRAINESLRDHPLELEANVREEDLRVDSECHAQRSRLPTKPTWLHFRAPSASANDKIKRTCKTHQTANMTLYIFHSFNESYQRESPRTPAGTQCECSRRRFASRQRVPCAATPTPNKPTWCRCRVPSASANAKIKRTCKTHQTTEYVHCIFFILSMRAINESLRERPLELEANVREEDLRVDSVCHAQRSRLPTKPTWWHCRAPSASASAKLRGYARHSNQPTFTLWCFLLISMYATKVCASSTVSHTWTDGLRVDSECHVQRSWLPANRRNAAVGHLQSQVVLIIKRKRMAHQTSE